MGDGFKELCGVPTRNFEGGGEPRKGERKDPLGGNRKEGLWY